MNTYTEENYLKAIFYLIQQGQEPISTNAIAEQVDTKASSVTDMIKRLAFKKLVNHQRYKGVTLTAAGRKKAIEIIRKHRLWEVFLYEYLEFKWDEVHEIAEELEHINSTLLIDRLEKFMDYPRHDPHGDPIPDSSGHFDLMDSISLSQFPKNSSGVVIGVDDKDSSFLNYLDKLNIRLGSELELIDWHSFDRSAEVRIDGERTVLLSSEAVKYILMNRTK